jgi:hypothetical protein
MKTVFEQDNADFSTRAHMVARELIYPAIFETDKLSFEDCTVGSTARGNILDGEMGVDRIVRVTVKNLPAPIVFTVQERFRKPEFARYRDITVTEWNYASNLPSELYKINAGLFLYGYYDDKKQLFLDAICLHTSCLLYAIVRHQISFGRKRNPKQQSFLTFGFDDLKDANTVAWRMEVT